MAGMTVNNSTYHVTNTCNKPRLKLVTDDKTSYIPLASGTAPNFYVKTNNSSYRPMIYKSVSSSESASGSATFTKTQANSAGLSSTTALTRAKTTATQYLTAPKTTGTVYGTRASISSTVYETSQYSYFKGTRESQISGAQQGATFNRSIIDGTMTSYSSQIGNGTRSVSGTFSVSTQQFAAGYYNTSSPLVYKGIENSFTIYYQSISSGIEIVTTATNYLTRVSTSATSYLTAPQTTATQYLTASETTAYKGVSSSSSSSSKSASRMDWV